MFFLQILQAARKGFFPNFVSEGGPAVGDFNLTNDQPVEILAFVEEILEQLSIALRTIKIPVNLAVTAAKVLEWVYSFPGIKSTPPITRFSISFFAFSKIFNSNKSVAAFGKPLVSMKECISRFVAWQKDYME